ncbi:hypothetical protein Bca4012_032950 [Brassica carinata]|nr:PREDICTED: auxin-responsive protein IAA8 [Brassica oleracea var. oleracea]VDD12672.1 unnamed protein product [Brassica oleracea]
MTYQLQSVDKEGLGTSTCLKERNYLGLSDCSSSVDSSTVPNLVLDTDKKSSLNFKATELRLGLPESSQSPQRETDFGLLSPRTPDEKLLFPLLPCKDHASGNKRGYLAKSGSNNAPASKAQVVGWPPIRSYRKNTMASSTSKNTNEVGLGPLFVKVSMDGAPYLRKVDLRTYTCYQHLSSALEKMFSCFTLGQCGLHGAHGRERMSEVKLKDLLHGSEFVLTYEDKDGDWMLVGDVPWEIFTESCRKLKIMKGSDSIGLAPSAVEKSKNKD